MSNFPVHRPRSPLAPAYRMEMTRRSAVGLTLSSVLAALLIFLSGLTIGIRLQFATPAAEASPAGGAVAGGAPATGSGLPTLAGEGSAFVAPGRIAPGTGGSAGSPEQATPAPAPPPAPADPEVGDDAFVLQFGAFRVQENAERLRGRLEERGYAAEIRATPSNADAPLYLVVVGRFASRSAATAAAERVRRETGDEVYVMSEGKPGS